MPAKAQGRSSKTVGARPAASAKRKPLRERIASCLATGNGYGYTGPPKESWGLLQRAEFEIRRWMCKKPGALMRCLKGVNGRAGCRPYFACGSAPHDNQGALCPDCGSGDIEAVVLRGNHIIPT